MYRRTVGTLGMIILVVLLLLTARYLILGGASKEVRLDAAPALSGVVSQSLAASQHASDLPLAGRDFTLQNIRHFDSQQWVVAKVQPVGNTFDPSLVVLEKINGSYEVVLGPGSAFESSYLLSLPEDVAHYLELQGVFYESVD